MADIETFTVQLAELLRHPEDLDKIPALKAEFARKKAAVDGQLKAGLREQLAVTQAGMGAIAESQRLVNQIKEEMMQIDKLCAESQHMIRDFPNVNEVSTIHRNFSLVETMKANIDTFNERLKDVELALVEDEGDLDNQPHLLNVHFELTRLREIRDEAMDQIRQTQDESLESTLQDYFVKLDEVVDVFDEHISYLSQHLIDMVQTDNRSMVVRLALIIEEEEKNDLKVRAMQDAQKEHKELASRFKSIKAGSKKARGYKEKFLKAIEDSAHAQLRETETVFQEDATKLEKALRWFFKDLFAVKEGMVGLMPKKWKIYRTYTNIYHRAMHDWLIALVDDQATSSLHMLHIIHWRDKYYAKMAKLGWSPADVQPDVLDDREAELVRDWRQLIVHSVDQWIARMFVADETALRNRDASALETDANGCFRTKGLGDMWRMLKEQIGVAGDSGRQDVTEGVLDEMFRVLKRRQGKWQKLVAEEVDKYARPGADAEGLQSLQDWLVAVANDQIACIDDNEATGQVGYLTRFRADFTPLVPPAHVARAEPELAALADGYVDLSTYCLTAFVQLIFDIDFRTTMPDFFGPKWYEQLSMARITSTFDDYAADYSAVLHRSLLDIFLEELADTLLVRYLRGVRHRGAKFRRQDPFVDKIGDDVRTAWAFFERFQPGLDFGAVKAKWKAVHHMVRLIEAEKANLPAAFEACKREFWDTPIGWVESVLKARDDYERSMLNAVKAKAAEVYMERGPETIMSKVK